MSTRGQGTTLFSAILILIATAVVVQLWLLTVAMEALLSGKHQILLPAAAGSTVLLRYSAVRNKGGNYLGTAELTQDIAPLRKLEGERRLLEYS